MSDGESGMYRFLLRLEHKGEETNDLYYAGGWQTGTHRAGEGDLIGVCVTPKNRRPDTASSRSEFRENVEELASDVRWFDEALTGGSA